MGHMCAGYEKALSGRSLESHAAAEDISEGWNAGWTAHFLALIAIHLSVNWLGVKYLSYEPGEADLWSGW